MQHSKCLADAVKRQTLNIQVPRGFPAYPTFMYTLVYMYVKLL